IAVVPLTALHLPNEPLLQLQLHGSTELTVDTPAKLTITPPPAPVALALQEAPPGLRLDGNTITWTPPTTAIGDARIVFRLSLPGHPGIERRESFTLTVRRPFVDLPFRPEDVRLSTDGK